MNNAVFGPEPIDRRIIFVVFFLGFSSMIAVFQEEIRSFCKFIQSARQRKLHSTNQPKKNQTNHRLVNLMMEIFTSACSRSLASSSPVCLYLSLPTAIVESLSFFDVVVVVADGVFRSAYNR